ncbi:MAG: ABC transporter ATP-binding protein [Flavobacteriaceae bacterium]|jgi:ATP-binding cassette subfamily B protein|nr:ABC transporter ATP-binding protein [Flavobacteriaceae bacterium]MBT3754007.1 ABC transporter ATP-binding protein [Flavobacteriaceae bacterium]MBT3794024.1 ABC transporter ATP-binding protein [Flavobacteriaceae bacterium]MBT4062483.1 ABC transporter ATP-binding protein [Flavobacteriaceae bacterium]MBT4414812.1 ABC transporter ATP-binding protein [Flavobacteriaceae bacterium]|tara:strand:+ start:1078 stop:2823 length:1746 start_codon:yes stop_codon:yes gene_type:complete
MLELKYLNKYLLKYKTKIIIGILITIIARIFALIAPNLIGNSITIIENYIFKSSSLDIQIVKSKLLTNILFIVSSAIIAGIFTFIMRQMLINVSRFIEFDLKNEIYKKYQSLNFDFYKNNRTGDLMNRISEDVSKVRMYIGPAIMYAITTLSLFIIVVTYMVNVAPKLTMYTLIPLPILSFIIYKISKIINFKSKVVQEFLSKLTTYTQESFSGIKIIKTYTIEKYINNELMNLAAESKEKNMSLVKIQAWFFPLMILLIGISNVIVVYIGGNQYMKGEIELGVLAEFIIYVNMLTWPVATVGWITSIVQQAEASQKRINEFLKTKSSIINVSNKKMIIDGKINFNKVSLTFKETGIKALNDITFSIKRGESIALMGNVGSGKSTLLELICRVYDPNYGEILLDENNIKKMNINELRDCIGYVPQSTFLFSDSIINNIKFGKLDASMEEVEESAETACLTKDIKSFKDKYETLLGERGVNLSGGQKQRLAIARAIIKKPKILILDDSLSAVDTETEEKILSGLSNVTKNMTVIIATHRVSSAKNCDKILILENGSIIEFGSHEDLINNNGYYSTSYQKQSS